MELELLKFELEAETDGIFARRRAEIGRNSIYRDDQPVRVSQETQDEIDFCLHHCPYANTECCDCLSGGKPERARKGAREKIDVERLKEMLRLKVPTAEICEEFGIREETLYRKKKKLGVI